MDGCCLWVVDDLVHDVVLLVVLHDQDPIQIGHFVSHDHTVEHGGFRTVLWEAPKDLRTAVEDVVAFLTYLQKRHRDLSQGATAQLCNRTAVHNQLLQHGFQTVWHGRLRITTTSSAAGATARIAVIVQTGCGLGVLVAQLVDADRLPVVVRFPAGPRVSFKW